jgi:hypothetical protein
MNNGYKEVHQYISTGLKDANNGGVAQNFSVNFNNPSICSVVSDVPTYFQPVYIALDWSYENITTKLQNNTLEFRTIEENGSRPNYLRFNNAATNSIKITIPNNNYSPQSLASTLQRLLNEVGATKGVAWNSSTNTRLEMNWVVEYDASINALTINFTTAYHAGSKGIEIVYKSTVPGSEYNVAKVIGFDPALDFFTIPKESAFETVGGARVLTEFYTNPYTVDLKIYDVIRLHSSMAKRYLEKKGGSLSNTDILLEILIPNNYGNGQTILIDYSGSPEIWRQSINPNFDNITFTLRDKLGNIIDLEPSCNFDISFKITRYIANQTKEDRLFNINSSHQTIGMI